MKRIWKFCIKGVGDQIEDQIEIGMPEGAEILCVQSQGEGVFIWAIVDDNMGYERRRFAVYGTGQEIDAITVERYIGTFQLYGGKLVFHLFGVPYK
jgi:hypothetical protein